VRVRARRLHDGGGVGRRGSAAGQGQPSSSRSKRGGGRTARAGSRSDHARTTSAKPQVRDESRFDRLVEWRLKRRMSRKYPVPD
jgi:hypothetical protein